MILANVDGERAEGLVSPVSEETADAERQTKDAWCGSRGSDWWLASVASMASMDAMASMASVAGWRRVASIATVMIMVLRALLTLEAQRITNVNDFLFLRSWASTKIGEPLKRDAQKPTVPRVTDGFRSPSIPPSTPPPEAPEQLPSQRPLVPSTPPTNRRQSFNSFAIN